MVERAHVAGELAVIKNETLGDGIRLEVIDASRPLVGDRWLVAAVFRLVIPVDAVLPAGEGAEPAPEQVRGLLGDPVVFEKRLERTFIGADQREAILQDMVRRYLDDVRAYISRPAFARNHLLKKYAEALERACWYADNSDRPPSATGAAAL